MGCKGRGEKKPTSLSSHACHATQCWDKEKLSTLEPYKQEKQVLKPRGGGRPEGCGVDPKQGLPSGLGSSHTETD